MAREQIEEHLKNLDGWSTDGRRIERSYSIPHIQGAAFIMHIAAIQNDLGHHSEATLGYRTVHVSISSSDIGGYVTERDISLARRIQVIASAHAAV
jgi:4a-hydroxytetrahydrobiopterin dehydratase